MLLKDVIQEKFGDGIMSAIDFTLTVDKEEDPKGDRVKVTMNGKFLSYRKWWVQLLLYCCRIFPFLLSKISRFSRSYEFVGSNKLAKKNIPKSDR